ncbi:tyrosine-type recombinase/integrase [Candidatus Woesearchaeota archaeon]|nr:tyrosine-type recombinase/integrase [Candidatus Woesearchaeota archaeon]
MLRVDDFGQEPEGDSIPPLVLEGGNGMQILVCQEQQHVEQAATLTKEEIFRIIDCAPNVRQKMLIQLLYGCGLLASETVRLRMDDIDLKKGMVYVSHGNKRCIPLPRGVARNMEFLLKYSKDNVHLFPNGYVEGHLSIESAERVVGHAAAAAGLKNPVSSYTLRHSFAAHLLESGTKVAIIQTLLGNYDATQIKHLHVSEEMIKKVKSPLDYL